MTNGKKQLLTDVSGAVHAIGRILDGGHNDIRCGELRDSCYDVLAGLVRLEITLVAEIGTDNL
jgi:hypothetical protein